MANRLIKFKILGQPITPADAYWSTYEALNCEFEDSHVSVLPHILKYKFPYFNYFILFRLLNVFYMSFIPKSSNNYLVKLIIMYFLPTCYVTTT